MKDQFDAYRATDRLPPSAEVIEARRALYWKIQGARSHMQMVRETEEAFAVYDAVVARAALNAAGAAVERDEADVAKEVPDFGNSITGLRPRIEALAEFFDSRAAEERGMGLADSREVPARMYTAREHWARADTWTLCADHARSALIPDVAFSSAADGLASAGSTQREPTDESRTGAALPKGLDEAAEMAFEANGGKYIQNHPRGREWFNAGFLAGAAWREAQVDEDKAEMFGLEPYTLYRHLCDALGIRPGPDMGHEYWDSAVARVRALAEAAAEHAEVAQPAEAQ
jgi:hypothetical protein